jgi:hypothetical protein
MLEMVNRKKKRVFPGSKNNSNKITYPSKTSYFGKSKSFKKEEIVAKRIFVFVVGRKNIGKKII